MYEEITELENDITKVINKHRDKKSIPVAVIVGVLETVKQITIDANVRLTETIPIKTEIPDDGGPGMTQVQKNLDEV